MRVQGNNGTIDFDGQEIRIDRDGLKAKIINRGRNVSATSIQLPSLTAVNFKSASLTKPGVIEFAVPGMTDESGVVFFDRKYSAQFEELRGAVEAAMRALRVPGAQTSAVDIGTQLSTLARLRDEGVLTEDEFQAQKAKLLRG